MREYLSPIIRFCKPFLNVTGYWKENLLHVQICLCTLQNTLFRYYTKIFNSITKEKIQSAANMQLTVSKNLIPYSSARAWPLEVGTAWKRDCFQLLQEKCVLVCICVRNTETQPLRSRIIDSPATHLFVTLIKVCVHRLQEAKLVIKVMQQRRGCLPT